MKSRAFRRGGVLVVIDSAAIGVELPIDANLENHLLAMERSHDPERREMARQARAAIAPVPPAPALTEPVIVGETHWWARFKRWLSRPMTEHDLEHMRAISDVPIDPNDWTEQDWRDLHDATEEAIRKIAARHAQANR